MTGGVWIASYVLLWLTVVVLGVSLIALLRQIGVLHARLRPMGVHFAGEGPERLAPAPMPQHFHYRESALTLVAFTSSNCPICATLLPGLRALARTYGEVAVEEIDHGPATQPVFDAFGVRSTPYVVAVDRAGIVQSRGVANSLEQIEVMVEECLRAPEMEEHA